MYLFIATNNTIAITDPNKQCPPVHNHNSTCNISGNRKVNILADTRSSSYLLSPPPLLPFSLPPIPLFFLLRPSCASYFGLDSVVNLKQSRKSQQVCCCLFFLLFLLLLLLYFTCLVCRQPPLPALAHIKFSSPSLSLAQLAVKDSCYETSN